jgi:hypothetical protein
LRYILQKSKEQKKTIQEKTMKGLSGYQARGKCWGPKKSRTKEIFFKKMKVAGERGKK